MLPVLMGTNVNNQSGIRITNIDSGVNGINISGNIANAKGLLTFLITMAI